MQYNCEQLVALLSCLEVVLLRDLLDRMVSPVKLGTLVEMVLTVSLELPVLTVATEPRENVVIPVRMELEVSLDRKEPLVCLDPLESLDDPVWTVARERLVETERLDDLVLTEERETKADPEPLVKLELEERPDVTEPRENLAELAVTDDLEALAQRETVVLLDVMAWMVPLDFPEPRDETEPPETEVFPVLTERMVLPDDPEQKDPLVLLEILDEM